MAGREGCLAVLEHHADNLDCPPKPSVLSLSKGCTSFLRLHRVHEEQDSPSTGSGQTGFGAW